MTFLTAADVAQQWGKSRRFVYDQLRTGALVGSYFGGQWHITPEAVAAFVAAHMHRPAQPKGRRRPRRTA